MSYVRGDGRITLTTDEINNLQTLLDKQTSSFNIDSFQVGLGAPLPLEVAKASVAPCAGC